MGIKVTWFGHAASMVETPMIKLLIDPFLSGNDKASVSPEEIEADVIAVTHGHADHVGDTVAIAKRTGAMVISNFEIINYFQAQGLENVHPLHIGGGRSFEWGRIKLTQAHHGSALPDGSYGGVAAGLLLSFGGAKIYHAGDTGLFSDMQLIGDENVDLAMLPIGDNFTMGPEDAVKAVKMLKPRYVIPMHYDTFDVIHQDPREFAIMVKKETQAEVQILNPGESFSLE